jgi:hypothetical protein
MLLARISCPHGKNAVMFVKCKRTNILFNDRNNMSRTFTIEKSENNVEGGHFVSGSPYNAAKKASRKLFKDEKTKTELRFTLREQTSGSAKKEFQYIAFKHVLSEPRIIKRGNVEIKVGTEYKVKSAC